MAIEKKILAIMESVQRLQKDDYVSFKNTSYKALSEEKVTSIMRKEMIAQKMIVYPIKQEWNREGIITHVDVTYRMMDTESGEYIDVVSCGVGADTQDKGSGKAMTYAFKYMWLRTFALPTGEDPDKIASDEIDAKEGKKISQKEAQVIGAILNENQREKWLEHFGKKTLADLSTEEYAQINEWIRKAQEKANGK